MSLADEIERIRRTIAEYCQLCDDGRFDEFGLLFTPDARFEVMGSVYEGRAAIAGFMAEFQPPEQRGKHVTTNAVIDVDEAAGTATASTDYVFVTPDVSSKFGEGELAMFGRFAVTSSGRYVDELVRDGDRWLFARRRIEFLRRD